MVKDDTAYIETLFFSSLWAAAHDHVVSRHG